MPRGAAPEFQVTVVWLPVAIETVSDVRWPMTGNEGRDSVERDDEHRGREYHQLDTGSSKRFERRLCRACYVSDDGRPLRMEHNQSRMR